MKLYFQEAGSTELGMAAAGRSDLIASNQTLTEVTSALSRRSREGADLEAARLIWGEMLTWVDTGALTLLELTPAVHREAERILLRPGTVALHASDALHLALARSGGAATVACYDQRMRAAASALGLHLYPPPGS